MDLLLCFLQLLTKHFKIHKAFGLRNSLPYHSALIYSFGECQIIESEENCTITKLRNFADFDLRYH